MADPPAGGPETPPTNTQETNGSFTEDDLEGRTTVESRKRTRSGDIFAPSDPAGRITTKEVWKLISTLKDVIRQQTTTIAATQNELQEQNERLHEEVKALRAQLESAPAVTATKTWAAVAANGGNTTPSLYHQQPEKEQNCVRISTQRTFIDPRDIEGSDGNAFRRYLTTDTVSTHIHTALQSDDPTQDVQGAGIGTTETGYLIRFKSTESVEAACNNTGWPHKLGNNSKLVKPRFGVVVHRTPTEEVDLAELGFHIDELAWMKAKDKAWSSPRCRLPEYGR